MSFILADMANMGIGQRVVERTIGAGYAALYGALLVVDGTGNYAEAGADPATINAVALTRGGADTSGFAIIGRKEFPSNKVQGVNPSGRKFRAKYLGTLPANSGSTYGVTRDTDSYWKVDFSKTGATARVTLISLFLTGAPELVNEVLVQILDANIGPN
jgi:hypothetical protein